MKERLLNYAATPLHPMLCSQALILEAFSLEFAIQFFNQ